MAKKKLVSMLLASAMSIAPVQAAELNSIYWMTEAPCSKLNGGPLISPYLQACSIGGVALSICPGVNFSSKSDPYNTNKPIQIIGYQINAFTQDRNMQMSFLVGSAAARGIQGADVFASCAGNGSINCSRTLSAPLTQGGIVSSDGNHIDIYGQCYYGNADSSVHLVVLLEYVSATQ